MQVIIDGNPITNLYRNFNPKNSPLSTFSPQLYLYSADNKRYTFRLQKYSFSGLIDYCLFFP